MSRLNISLDEETPISACAEEQRRPYGGQPQEGQSREEQPYAPLVISQSSNPRPPLVVITSALSEGSPGPLDDQMMPKAPGVPDGQVAFVIPGVPDGQLAPAASGVPGNQSIPEVQDEPGDPNVSEVHSTQQMPPPLTLSVAPVVAQPPLVLQVTLFEQDAAVKTPPTKSAPQLKARSVPRGDTKAIAKQRAAKKTRRAFLVAFRDTLVAFALFALLLQFFSPTIVREHSMENTLKENDIVYIAQKAYWFGDPQHEDIVVFYSTLSDGSGGRKTLVKRVIGVPGDRIAINGGTVYRNGQALSEPYVKSGETRGNLAGLVVPEDSYFVLGDNREVSNDSRNAEIGFIDKDQLRGKVLFRIFPLSDLQVF